MNDLYPSSTISGQKLKDPRPIDERFQEFHTQHPEIFDEIVKMARAVLAAGFKRYSVNTIYETLRWHYHMTRGNRDFKLNDHFTSRYARLVLSTCPEFPVDFFELRTLKAK